MPAGSGTSGTDGTKLYDDKGVLRVVLGSVPTIGNSAAHWGIAVYDASGNPVFDTAGLIAVMKPIASASIAYGTHNFTGVATPLGISGVGGEVTLMTTTFTLTRTQSVRIDTVVAGSVAVTGGFHAAYSPVYIRVTGQANSVPAGVNIFFTTDTQGNSNLSAETYQVLNALPPATYTVGVYWNSIDGTSAVLTVIAAELDVFLLGG